jgi:hypothetical protein
VIIKLFYFLWGDDKRHSRPRDPRFQTIDTVDSLTVLRSLETPWVVLTWVIPAAID